MGLYDPVEKMGWVESPRHPDAVLTRQEAEGKACSRWMRYRFTSRYGRGCSGRVVLKTQ